MMKQTLRIKLVYQSKCCDGAIDNLMQGEDEFVSVDYTLDVAGAITGSESVVLQVRCEKIVMYDDNTFGQRV